MITCAHKGSGLISTERSYGNDVSAACHCRQELARAGNAVAARRNTNNLWRAPHAYSALPCRTHLLQCCCRTCTRVGQQHTAPVHPKMYRTLTGILLTKMCIMQRLVSTCLQERYSWNEGHEHSMAVMLQRHWYGKPRSSQRSHKRKFFGCRKPR